MQTLINFIGWSGVCLFVLIAVCTVGGVTWVNECALPAKDAAIVASWAAQTARRELKSSGSVGDVDYLIQAPRRRGDHSLDRYFAEYRVVTHQSGSGYEIVVEPRHWCFCRPTVVYPIKEERAKR
jgi:hypothetical protein